MLTFPVFLTIIIVESTFHTNELLFFFQLVDSYPDRVGQ